MRFIRFGLVGISNTIIDLVILNILVTLFRVNGDGWVYMLCKAASFTCAVINSYFWNKHWVFNANSRDSSQEGLAREQISFFAISVVGLGVNVSTSSLALSLGLAAAPALSERLVINAAAIIGTIVVLIFNFLGYRYFVFKR